MIDSSFIPNKRGSIKQNNILLNKKIINGNKIITMSKKNYEENNNNFPKNIFTEEETFIDPNRCELQECEAFLRSLRDNILFRFAEQYIIGGQKEKQ